MRGRFGDEAVAGQGATTTLVYAGTQFTEYFPDGKKYHYQAQVG